MLHEPVPVEPADKVGGVHFIAIGGAGMSGIAQLFAERGIAVSGSDQAPSGTLDRLRSLGVTTFVGHDAAQLGAVETVVVSSAIRESNPELAAARARGLRVWHRSTALAALMAGHVGVSIAGTHGKTTTTGLAAVMLAAAGADPSYVIGSPLANTGVTAHLGAGEVFIAEADESDGSFRQYPTTIAVVTNVEADHLDNWGTPDRYAAGFVEFAAAESVSSVVLNSDDPGTVALAAILRAAGRRVVSYGEGDAAEVRLTGLTYSGSTARATITDAGFSGTLALRVPGRYNLHNAAAAFAVGRELGLDPGLLLSGAADFAGTLRRFQPIAEVAGIRIVDDYAHHPTEVAATLIAARQAAGGGRVIACFQPHLYSRTRDFQAEFGEALALADEIVLLDVYGAREDPMPGVTSHLIAQAALRHCDAERVHEVGPMAAAAPFLAGLARAGDLVLTIGAGDVTRVGPALAAELAGR